MRRKMAFRLHCWWWERSNRMAYDAARGTFGYGRIRATICRVTWR